MKISAKSDKGMMRAENQDSFSTGELPNSAAWAVVCDGMGGAAGGRTASTTAVRIISEKISSGFNPRMSDLSVKNLLISAVESANAVLYDMALNDEALNGMGTTVTAALVNTDRLYVASAGDSRVYLISDKIIQVTTDHSLVQEMVNRGEITKEEASIHPKKNIITRALGIDGDIRVDFFQEEFNKEKDIVLLCSD
ncbi:MAG: serine/threonine-protein phosphatase, partial [Clostridia bacterium]|nr:serine/threonine-protein phosphatase [Clostridia bacterium]